jgi:hypothetical protein
MRCPSIERLMGFFLFSETVFKKLLTMTQMSEFCETRNIALPKGGTLEVQVTNEFLVKIRQHFMLDQTQPVTDEHIRMFVWGAMNNAVEKAATNA